MDVANFASNYAAVNVPFSLGVTYESVFSSCPDLGCTFPPDVRDRHGVSA
jgi:cell wall assembly regulator SMI1